MRRDKHTSRVLEIDFSTAIRTRVYVIVENAFMLFHNPYFSD